jgi:hypothetical protein
VQFLLDAGGKPVEFFVEIVFLVIGVGAADHNSVSVLGLILFFLIFKIDWFHMLSIPLIGVFVLLEIVPPGYVPGGFSAEKSH